MQDTVRSIRQRDASPWFPAAVRFQLFPGCSPKQSSSVGFLTPSLAEKAADQRKESAPFSSTSISDMSN